MAKVNRKQTRERRRARVRARIVGTAVRPRLNIFRSLTKIDLQLIDDSEGKTIVSASSKKDIKNGDAGERKGMVAKAYLLGLVLAEKAKEKNIESIVFDRAGYLYHGRVKAVAEGAREGGLKF
ncbi:MAG: 50S ribosomal protein L18 [Candidatus Magasanikbacteria bacterium CG_4_9_14_3_um_filter_32_9]|uniref:Large ribosomal subunit protein uL18 n=1 Tax=Candidatus Magasanikbacteria bacterium CG_4_9_14_3_um_filter_32_9 TaxID=1974644 RepID=A0A2M7Z7L9_9BACT|nr:MAG: 50S ribosomal protein L18 [Candidatus Magasanikbacteria bacterium CG_4_9_14_3_um_filter_32_9]